MTVGWAGKVSSSASCTHLVQGLVVLPVFQNLIIDAKTEHAVQVQIQVIFLVPGPVDVGIKIECGVLLRISIQGKVSAQNPSLIFGPALTYSLTRAGLSLVSIPETPISTSPLTSLSSATAAVVIVIKVRTDNNASSHLWLASCFASLS